jgi:hypothetical protein
MGPHLRRASTFLVFVPLPTMLTTTLQRGSLVLRVVEELQSTSASVVEAPPPLPRLHLPELSHGRRCCSGVVAGQLCYKRRPVVVSGGATIEKAAAVRKAGDLATWGGRPCYMWRPVLLHGRQPVLLPVVAERDALLHGAPVFAIVDGRCCYKGTAGLATGGGWCCYKGRKALLQ